MKWEDFVREYENAATGYLQILHSGGTGDRVPNYLGQPPGYAQALRHAQPGRAKTLGASRGREVDIKFRIFVPSPAVAMSLPVIGTRAFGGDGRGFSYDQGSHRGVIHALVRLPTSDADGQITVLDRSWGQSTEYATADIVHVPGQPDWYTNLRDGAHPIARETLRATSENLSIAFGGATAFHDFQSVASQSTVLTIHAAGANPLVTGSPDIDADLNLYLKMEQGVLRCRVMGSHDGFPAYELYIDGQRVYAHDPIAAGASPMALLPPSDIDVDTDWIDVTRTGSQMAVTHGRTTRPPASAAARAFGDQSFSVNWDEVQSIAQPTDVSCWAAAAAMVVGWRDRMSLPPEAIAEIAGRTTATGLDPAQVEQFANEMGLSFEYPQCYTIDGFRQLLETNGPLWIASAVPGLHAIVVTGMYHDGTNSYVRITDPWDRQVGTPGAPGPYLNTHSTGSRYIMKWEDFVREYENAATGYLQILHSGGTGDRVPNYLGQPPGYAQALRHAQPGRARALELPRLSLSSDRVPIPPPSLRVLSAAEASVVRAVLAGLPPPIGPMIAALPAATSAAGVSIGIGPSGSAAGGPGFQVGAGLGAGVVFGSGGEIGVYGGAEVQAGLGEIFSASATAQFTVVRGGIQLFNGLGFAAGIAGGEGIVGGARALFDAALNFIGVTFELGIGVGDPLRIYGAIQGQIATQLAAAQAYQPAVAAGHRLPEAPRPYALSSNGVPRSANSQRRETGSSNGVRWDLAQLDGLRTADGQALPSPNGNARVRQVRLDEWPYVPGEGGDTRLPIQISWEYDKGAVGNVRIGAGQASAANGWTLDATADITDSPASNGMAAVNVTVRQRFRHSGEPDVVAVSDMTLFGDGSFQRADRWERTQAAAA
jgi:hypothetical protein